MKVIKEVTKNYKFEFTHNEMERLFAKLKHMSGYDYDDNWFLTKSPVEEFEELLINMCKALHDEER